MFLRKLKIQTCYIWLFLFIIVDTAFFQLWFDWSWRLCIMGRWGVVAYIWNFWWTWIVICSVIIVVWIWSIICVLTYFNWVPIHSSFSISVVGVECLYIYDSWRSVALVLAPRLLRIWWWINKIYNLIIKIIENSCDIIWGNILLSIRKITVWMWILYK